jgi:MFS transporter, DHA2 family, methylenomycin A resistance protein
MERSRAWPLVTICLGYFMVILDTTVVNVALPSIEKQLGATVAGLQWVVDGYALVFASLLLTAGALGDRLGSKRVFLAGLVLFTVTSALCGAAPTLGALVAFRVAQGVGAALLVPASLALLRHTFTDPVRRARAIGLWGAIAGIAAGGGPVLGGVLVAALGWRSVFLVNIPIGLLGILLALHVVAPAPPLPQRGLDLAAQVAGIVALGLLTFAFIEGGSSGWWSPRILGAYGLCAVAAAAFMATERRATSPMLPLGLFSSPTFSAGTVVGLLINFGFYGQLFLLSLFFQQVRGYSALVTGMALLPETGVVALSSFLSGRLTGRVGPRLPMAIGLAAGGVGLLALVLVGPKTAYPAIAAMLGTVGFGMSFTMPAMTAAVVEEAPHERAGIAAAVLNASRQVGGVLGVALLGAFVSRHSSFVPGMHVALVIAGGAFLVGCLLTLLAVQRG